MINLINFIFSSKKNLMHFFYFLLGLSLFLSGCSSTEKSSHDSAINKPKEFQSSQNRAQREISYLKNISQFEDSNFKFVAQQMKTVIKNHSRMKRQLIKIEKKLDKFLSQSLLKSSIPKGPMTAPAETLAPLLEKETDHQTEPKTSPLLEKEITGDSHIFPEEGMGEEEYKESQKSALEKLSTPHQNPSLTEAKNLFKKKSYESAISKFQKYRDENPQGAYYPEATFYIGQSFKNLKMPIEAKVFFKEIIKSYPNSLWASRAKKNLKE